MEKSEVCAEISMPVREKKAKVLASKTERKRFKPKLIGKYVSGATLEVMLIPKEEKAPKDNGEMCFRLNGELAPVPQNEEEDKILDKTVWDYMTKKVANNISDMVEKGFVFAIWVAGESIVEEKDRNGIQKDLVFPPKGELDWIHPWSGARIKSYKEVQICRSQSWPLHIWYYGL